MRPVCVIASLVALVGCSSHASVGDAAGRAAANADTRDSSGVRIITYAAAALDAAPPLTLDTNLAVIGAGNDSLDLSRVGDAIVLRDGRVAAFVAGTLHIFTADGRGDERIGRAGAGPGEFRDPTLARGQGDTLLVTDRPNGRLSWVVPGQGIVRERPVQLSAARFMYDAVTGLAGDTVIVSTQSYAVAMNVKPGHVPLAVGRVVAASDTVQEIRPLDGTDMVNWSGPQLSDVAVEVRTAAARYSPSSYAVAWGPGFFAGRSDRWVLDQYDAGGSVVLSVRFQHPRVPITAAMRDSDVVAMVARLRARSSGAFDTERYTRWLAGLPYEDSLPAFGPPMGSPGGTLWLLEPAMQYDSTVTAVGIAPDGRIVGQLRGRGLSIIAFGDDRVVTRHVDENGIVTWVVRRLRR